MASRATTIYTAALPIWHAVLESQQDNSPWQPRFYGANLTELGTLIAIQHPNHAMPRLTEREREQVLEQQILTISSFIVSFIVNHSKINSTRLSLQQFFHV